MTEGGICVALVFALIGGASATTTFFKAKGDGLCVTKIAKGPVMKGETLVFGFDCTDPASGWTGTSVMTTTNPSTGIMVEFVGLYTVTKVDLTTADYSVNTIVAKVPDPTKVATKDSGKVADGLVYTTLGAYWKDTKGGIMAALMNAFLLNMPETSMNTVDVPLNEDGTWKEAKGMCLSPPASDGACGAKRTFQSPMIITLFYGYFGYDITWGTMNFLTLGLVYCMAPNVSPFFNDNFKTGLAQVKSTTKVTSMIFYAGGKKSFLYWAIDNKYTTQEWTSYTAPKAASEKTGTTETRLYQGVANPDASSYSGCFAVVVSLAKSMLKANKSFLQALAATTGEFDGAPAKATTATTATAATAATTATTATAATGATTATTGTAATTATAATTGTVKKPKMTKMNGGEKGKTYGGVPTKGKATGAAAAATGATTATAATTGTDASCANHHDSFAVITMMSVLTMLKMAL